MTEMILGDTELVLSTGVSYCEDSRDCESSCTSESREAILSHENNSGAETLIYDYKMANAGS